MTPPHGFIDKPKGKTRNDFALPKDEKEKSIVVVRRWLSRG
jgi:hypothetical protein